jgi:hypothetical protein
MNENVLPMFANAVMTLLPACTDFGNLRVEAELTTVVIDPGELPAMPGGVIDAGVCVRAGA